MDFVSSKLAGLLSMLGTIIGLVLGGATIKYNVYLGAAFFLLAAVSFITFVAFLYHFIKYAQYEMPYEDFVDVDEEEKENP